MRITIHEEKNSHFTFHGEKKGPITTHENTLYHPHPTSFNLLQLVSDLFLARRNEFLDARPNDSNISTQYIPTLLAHQFRAPAKRSQHFNATHSNIVGRNMLPAFGLPVATCCDFLRVENQTNAHAQAQHCWTYYNIMQHPQHHATSIFKFEPATPNISQHGGQTHSWIYVSGNIWTSPRSDKVRNTLSRWKKISSTHYWSLSATNHLRPRLRN